jgi:hypothetical protein
MSALLLFLFCFSDHLKAHYVSESEMKFNVSHSSIGTESAFRSSATISLTSFSYMFGLVSYYPFDGNANDASGNNRHGTATNVAVTADRFGNPNSALSFDGSSSWINFGSSASYALNHDFTVSVWVKKPNQNFGWIMWTGPCSGSYSSWMLCIDQNQKVSFEKCGFGNTWLEGPSVTNNVWTHLVIQVRSDGDTGYLYINGALSGSSNAGGPFALPSPSTLTVGKRGNGNSEWLSGVLDDMIIFNRVLSSAEILEIYNQPPPTREPTPQPTRNPTFQPTRSPTVAPTPQPTFYPTHQPTYFPSGQPSCQPTSRPSSQPSGQPSRQPTSQPISAPSAQPSKLPSSQPSSTPSGQPTNRPSVQPSSLPTAQPTIVPSTQPSSLPSVQPTDVPSDQPSTLPTSQPSGFPSVQPTMVPSMQPTALPTCQPTSNPSCQPTSQPSSQPSGFPTTQPSSVPSIQPSSQPSMIPTSQPSSTPSSQPSGVPSDQPSSLPSGLPTEQPTSIPSAQPSVVPSSQPSALPTGQPTSQPSCIPTVQPTEQPSGFPSSQPTSFPSMQPTSSPTSQPSDCPSSQPSTIPSSQPSCQPTAQPSGFPSSQPSSFPTSQPTTVPSAQPSAIPSVQPSGFPSRQPSSLPTSQPTTLPTEQPTIQPTASPSTQPSCEPTSQPSGFPSSQPTSFPSTQPTCSPTEQPSDRPSVQPSTSPSCQPTAQPSGFPSSQPSSYPTCQPTNLPSAQPSGLPSTQPTTVPSSQPSSSPSSQPSFQPTSQPSGFPSSQPTSLPSIQPTCRPTFQPSTSPSCQPSAQPSGYPSSQPSSFPTHQPTIFPSSQPTTSPSAEPSNQPTSKPSIHPTMRPSVQPSSSPTIQPTAAPTGYPSSGPTRQPSFTETTIRTQGSLFLLGASFPSSSVDDSDSAFESSLTDLPSAIERHDSYIVFGQSQNIEFNINIDNDLQKGLVAPLEPSLFSNQFFRSSRIVGDINGDGYSDLAVGSPRSCFCKVYLGTKHGLIHSPAAFSLTGPANSDFGWDISGAGDLNHDDIDDLLVSAKAINAIYVIFGNRVVKDIDVENLHWYDGFKIFGGNAAINIGISIGSAGDFNHDGYADIAFSALSLREGVVFVLFGAEEYGDISLDELNETRLFNIITPSTSFTGFSLVGVGDMNGDGYDDIAIGSLSYRGGYQTQRTYLIYGRRRTNSELGSEGLEIFRMAEGIDGITIIGGGFIVASPGDVNNDGIPDLMLINYPRWQGQRNSYLIRFPRNISSSPTLFPSSFPSSFPTPRTMPSSFPTIARPSPPVFLDQSLTRQPFTVRPSKSPSCRPTLPSNSSYSPTVRTIVTLRPSPSLVRQFSSRPSSVPLVLVKTESPTTLNFTSSFETIYCNNTAICQGSSAVNQFIVHTEGVIRTQCKMLQRCIYRIFPVENNVVVITEIFDIKKDIIDVSAFLWIKNIDDIAFSAHPVIIFLGTTQMLTFQNIKNISFTSNNFYFAQETQKSVSSNGTAFQFAMFGLCIGLIIFMGILIDNLETNNDHEEKVEIAENEWQEQIPVENIKKESDEELNQKMFSEFDSFLLSCSESEIEDGDSESDNSSMEERQELSENDWNLFPSLQSFFSSENDSVETLEEIELVLGVFNVVDPEEVDEQSFIFTESDDQQETVDIIDIEGNYSDNDSDDMASFNDSHGKM